MGNHELIEKLRRRDQRAYEAIIDEYARLLWVVAGRYLPKSAGFFAEDVEECVSDAFFQLWQYPERFDAGKGSLKTYLCTLARNRAVSAFRKQTRNSTVSLEDCYEQLAAAQPEDPIDYQALYEAIACLSEPTREILIRRYFYEQKPAAIAEAMGRAKKDVENRLYRAKRTLSVSLSDDREDQR